MVITGLAAISSAGVGIQPLAEALKDEQSRLQLIPEEVTGKTGFLWGKAAFKASDFMPPLKSRKFDRASLFAIVAAGMAMKHAGIDPAALDPARIGIVLGCGFGGIANSEGFLSSYFTKGVEGLAPMLFPNTVPNAPASNASIEHGLKGPNSTMVQRFCSAESALMLAARLLEEDRADVMITGGVDDLNPLMIKGFDAAGQLRHYAAGFGEGAGLLVMEREEHARRRGAKVVSRLGEIRTIGMLVKGAENEGYSRLVGSTAGRAVISVSGSAGEMMAAAGLTGDGKIIEPGTTLGRSLAMGGVAMVSLLLSLRPDQNGLHIGASPEGPYYAVEFTGGISA